MRVFVFAFIFVFSFSAYARRDLVEVMMDGVSTKTSRSQARKEIFDKSVKSVSRRYIVEMIGEAKYNSNETLIENRVLKNSGKYVPFIKGGKASRSAEGFRMPVTIKISLQSLKAILREEGLLYADDGPAVALPFIEMKDSINATSYKWWMHSPTDPTKTFLVKEYRKLTKALQASFGAKGFYVHRPSVFSFGQLIPGVFRQESLRSEDWLVMGSLFRSQMIIKGYVKFSPSRQLSDGVRIDINWLVNHTSNGRFVAGVNRSFQSEGGRFELVAAKKLDEVISQATGDLAVQVLESWQRGTFGSVALKMAVRGNLNYLQLERFKDQVQSRMSEIKSLRERYFTPGQVVFEVDVSGGSSDFANRLQKVSLKGFSLRVAEVSQEGLVLDVFPE